MLELPCTSPKPRGAPLRSDGRSRPGPNGSNGSCPNTRARAGGSAAGERAATQVVRGRWLRGARRQFRSFSESTGRQLSTHWTRPSPRTPWPESGGSGGGWLAQCAGIEVGILRVSRIIRRRRAGVLVGVRLVAFNRIRRHWGAVRLFAVCHRFVLRWRPYYV